MPNSVVEIHRFTFPLMRKRKLKGSSNDPATNRDRVPADAVNQQSKQRCSKHSSQEYITVYPARVLQGQAMRVLEILYREGAAKRKDDGIERDANTHDVPILRAEVQQIAPINALALRRDGERAPLCFTPIHEPIN
jgi:hypothetical protein